MKLWKEDPLSIDCLKHTEDLDDSALAEIDRQLYRFAVLGEGINITMTQEIWERCLYICIMTGDSQQYKQLWNDHPDFAEKMMQEFNDTADSANFHVEKEQAKASWKHCTERMKSEGIF